VLAETDPPAHLNRSNLRHRAMGRG
jgi:hypothetical protein